MVTVGAIIQVRLGSERLPGKALLPLPFGGGPALLEHVVQRASATPGLAKVVVATTEQPADDAIQAFCESHGIGCYRGATDDVLERFLNAAKANSLDVVVRLTGDNPFIFPETVAYAVQQHMANSADYTITEGLPLGTNVEVVNLRALERAAQEATEAADKEHVTPYVRREESFKRQSLRIESSLSTLRLTVDYPSDYALASLVYERLYEVKSLFGLADVERLLQENPWVSAVNAHNTQRKGFVSEKEEMEAAEKLLQKGGFLRVLRRLRKANDE
ncbi:glycosyltransferase family protein [Pontibacter brevis]